jgi:hypothetical protein
VRQPAAGARAPQGEGCLTKGVYIEMMIDNLKVICPKHQHFTNFKGILKETSTVQMLFDLNLNNLKGF